jgi:hypothetical protein
MNRSADQIRAQITATRASLDWRLDRLAARLHDLDPRVRLGAEPLKRIGAVAAVATGVVMLIRNVRTLRRRRFTVRRTAFPVL